MKGKIFVYIFFSIFMLVLVGFYILRNIKVERTIDETRTVFIKKTDNGFQLIRKGKPFYIKGGAGNSHFKELSEAGGNTIRLYDTLNLANNLDEAEKYGLSVIVDIPIPRNQFDLYSNEQRNLVLKQKVRDLIKHHKKHPALLIWNLGNELFYPKFSWKNFFRNNLFVNTFNDLIEIIHDEDPNHPVSTSLFSTSLGQLANIRIFSPNIDLLAFNVFSDIRNMSSKIDKSSQLFGVIPYYLSEFGIQGYWESEYTSWRAPIEPTTTKKIEQINERYKIIADKRNECLGSLIFFWGAKYERTYTWFSLFSDNNKSEVINSLEILWNKANTNNSLIGLEYMLVDGRGAARNIVFSSGEVKMAELKFFSDYKNQTKIKWKILPEGWELDEEDMALNPLTINDLFIEIKDDKLIFITPNAEGPYRIYAFVYDENGYFATTNTPFYVLDPK